MRILMIAPEPWFTPRGTPFSILHRIFAMSKLGHDVDLVTYHLGENINIKNLTIYRIPHLPFIKKIKVGPSKSKVIADVFVLLVVLKLLHRNRYDLIHSHEEASFFATFISKLYKTPHIYDMHSSLPQQLTNFKFTRSQFLIRLFLWLENLTLSRADGIVTICPELEKYVETSFPNKPSVLIENVADNSLIFKSNGQNVQNLKRQLHLDGESVVLYYGTFEPYQGIDLLIEGSTKVVQNTDGAVRFLLVGGNPAQVALYQKIVQEKGLSQYFIFTGSVHPRQVPVFVKKANVLVSPRIEGNNTPLKIYSYLRSGKPIVATRHLTHTQVLNDDVAILTDCNPASFADGILRALRDQKVSQKLVTNARRLADDRYNYKDYLTKLNWIIKRATNIGSGGGL